MTTLILDSEKLNGTEVIQIYGSSQLVTTGTIAALSTGGSGGGGVTQQRIVISGASDTTPAINTFIGWNSAASNNKTENIPTSTGSLGIIIINDLIGTAFSFPITAVPFTGSIIGPAEVYTNFGSITLLDTSAGWVSI